MKLYLALLTFNLFDLNHLQFFEILLLSVIDMVLTESFLNLQVRALSSANNGNEKKGNL